MDRLDLSRINGKKYKVLSGRDLGAEARLFFIYVTEDLSMIYVCK